MTLNYGSPNWIVFVEVNDVRSLSPAANGADKVWQCYVNGGRPAVCRGGVRTPPRQGLQAGGAPAR